MERIRFYFENERKNQWVNILDSTLLVVLIICFCCSPCLGIQEFLNEHLGVTDFGANVIVVLGTIFLGYLEQFITYQIDKRIHK